ncbi:MULTISPECIES: hypothetical protein [Stenotrophomonas]|uniref:hypothetical protein n=1 Tax=Stenotrophomonas TaxID=40323 RepID=UPI001CF11FD7|nr:MULTISPECIES: hypothetical protein [Stenotrophomonas]MCA7024126.1 hypothetical protein [Stenotrophomonas acidaminiphila]MCE4074877.1 hypothetical protein [Stenotrophomonas acidaminiphila]
MKTAQEIVDSRLVLRSLCAALAYRVHQVAIGDIPFDYWLPVSLLGALYAACLFGHVALKGRLPSFMARAGGSAGD